MKGTTHALFRVATSHRTCYEIIADHTHNSGDHVHNSSDHAHNSGDHTHNSGDHVHNRGHHMTVVWPYGFSYALTASSQKENFFVSISQKAVLFAFHLMASLVINSLIYGLVRTTLNIPQELW